MRLATRDASRHILCPECRRRTRLYRLNDGRRKCSSCGKKFKVQKRQRQQRLEQYAVLLLCFCLDFTALRTVSVTGLRYALIAAVFAEFRRMIAEQHLSYIPDEGPPRLHVSACSQCARRSAKGVLIVFAMQSVRGKIRVVRAEAAAAQEGDPPDDRSGYIAYWCHGAFHRRTADAPAGEMERIIAFWGWAEERLRAHHGVNTRNVWFYLKEREWKYNNRHLKPQMQAMRLLLMLPPDFLRT